MIDRGRWVRLGSEAESADRAAGHVGPISREDLESALAGHHEADLAELAEVDRAEAVEALVEGYGGAVQCGLVELLDRYVASREAGRRDEAEAARAALQELCEELAWHATWEITGIAPHGDVYASDPDGRRYTFVALGWRVFGCAPWSEDVGKRWLTVERVATPAPVVAQVIENWPTCQLELTMPKKLTEKQIVILRTVRDDGDADGVYVEVGGPTPGMARRNADRALEALARRGLLVDAGRGMLDAQRG